MKDNSDTTQNRRQFLGSANCAALGSIGFYNALINLKMMGNAAAQNTGAGGGVKAAVCLFLRGGNDSYNMLVPTTADEYSNYQAIRSNMALPAVGSGTDAILPLNRQDSSKTPANNGRSFGLNSAMTGMQGLFNQGDLAFVSNVGTLVEPATVAQYKAGTVRLPQSLFAHNAQIMEWQTSVPQGGSGTGWLGRIADVLNPAYNSGSVSMNISLAGNNTMQVGKDSIHYTISSNGSVGLTGEGIQGGSATRVAKTQSLMEEHYKNLYVDTFAKSSKQSFELHGDFSSAFDGVALTTEFPNTSLGRDLKAIVKTIASSATLGHQRQTYFVERGGFDNHANLLVNQSRLLSEVDGAVTAFWNALGELGLQDDILLFSASDFSRTLRSNGLGTDHAWGGNQFVLGGSVDGGKIYGEYPDAGELTIAGGLDVGANGRLLPTTSIDEYYAELATWLGVASSDLGQVFPNLNNFWDGAGSPLGYIA